MKNLIQQIPMKTVSLEFERKQGKKKKKELRKTLCYSSNYKKRYFAKSSAQQDNPILSEVHKIQTHNTKSTTSTPLYAESIRHAVLHKGSCKEIKETIIEKLGVDGCVKNKVPKNRISEPALSQFQTIVSEIRIDERKTEKKEVLKKVENKQVKQPRRLLTSATVKCVNRTNRSNSNKKEQIKSKLQKKVFKTNQINFSSPFGSFEYVHSIPLCQKITMSSINKMYQGCIKDLKESEKEDLKKRTIKTQAKIQLEKRKSSIDIKNDGWMQNCEKRNFLKQIELLNPSRTWKKIDGPIDEEFITDFSKSIIVKRKNLDPQKEIIAKKIKQQKLNLRRSQQKSKNYKQRKSCTLEDDFKVDGWQQGNKDFQQNQYLFHNA